MRGLTAGLWAHGAFFGVTKNARRFPATIRYINAFMKFRTGGSWTSFILLRNVKMAVHRDNHNEVGTSTVTTTFGTFSGGELWIAGEPPHFEGAPVAYRKDENGQRIKGVIVDTREKPVWLDPKVHHGTQRWTGTRWCLSCYTSRAHEKLEPALREQLLELGFPLSAAGETRTSGDSVACNTSLDNQEPHRHDGEVSSPMNCTPHDVKSSSVAQRKLNSVNSATSSGEDQALRHGVEDDSSAAQGGVRESHPGEDGRVRHRTSGSTTWRGSSRFGRWCDRRKLPLPYP